MLTPKSTAAVCGSASRCRIRKVVQVKPVPGSAHAGRWPFRCLHRENHDLNGVFFSSKLIDAVFKTVFFVILVEYVQNKIKINQKHQ
jgi:hypothetical protein